MYSPVSEAWSGAEKRKHKRVPLGVPVECRSGQRTITGRAENISLSGLLIRTDESIPEDQELTLSFHLPTAEPQIRCRARVAHVVPGAFIGVEFLELAPEFSSLVDRYVAGLPALQARRA